LTRGKKQQRQRERAKLSRGGGSLWAQERWRESIEREREEEAKFYSAVVTET